MVYETTELPAPLIDEIARVVAAELHRVARLMPPSPAAELGRLGRAQSDRGARLQRPLEAQLPPGLRLKSAATEGLVSLPPTVAERLLGALEMTVAALDGAAPARSAAGSGRAVGPNDHRLHGEPERDGL